MDVDRRQLVGRRLKDVAVVMDLDELAPVGGWAAGKPETEQSAREIPAKLLFDVCRDGVPVSAKIRLGCAETCKTAVEVAQRIAEVAAACLTVHGRVAAQFFSGSADWDAIAAVKKSLSRLPGDTAGRLHAWPAK
jgi:hypothetical protein